MFSGFTIAAIGIAQVMTFIYFILLNFGNWMKMTVGSLCQPWFWTFKVFELTVYFLNPHMVRCVMQLLSTETTLVPHMANLLRPGGHDVSRKDSLAAYQP